MTEQRTFAGPDGIESGDFLERLHRPPDGPFWRPIFRLWLTWGGGVFWVLLAWRLVRLVEAVLR